jgi:hypothetical protein
MSIISRRHIGQSGFLDFDNIFVVVVEEVVDCLLVIVSFNITVVESDFIEDSFFNVVALFFLILIKII